MVKSNANKGFSLIELIIVIAIMAVLVGVLAPQFIKYVESSRQSKDMQAVDTFKETIEAYVADEMAAGCGMEDVTITWEKGKAIEVAGGCEGHLVDEYCSEIGCDYTITSDGWNGGTATYDVDEYSWSTDVDSDINTKTPHKDMVKVFQ